MRGWDEAHGNIYSELENLVINAQKISHEGGFILRPRASAGRQFISRPRPHIDDYGKFQITLMLILCIILRANIVCIVDL